jgi:hypothetical protein
MATGVTLRNSILAVSGALDDASAELDRIALITDDPEAVELAAYAVFRSLSDMIAREAARVRASR